MKRLVLCLATLSFITTNVFSQWESIDIEGINTQNLYDVFFIDQTTGWIAGQNVIYKTQDGGDTWTAQNPPISDTRYYSIFFKDEMNGWAVGKKATASTAGRVHYTTDGGDNWLVYQTGASLPWWSTAFADADNGTIVGQEGQILYSSNGGATWNNRASPIGDIGASYDVDFIDSTTGYIVGSSSPSVGYILRTVNSGNGWTIVNSNISGGLYGLDFIDESIGFAVGSNGTILKTIDSGFTWTPKTSGVTSRLEDVHFIDENNGFAVGFSGTLLSTTDGGETWTNQSINTTTLRAIFTNNVTKSWSVGSIGEILKFCNECESLNAVNVDFDMTEHDLKIADLSIAADGSQATKFKYHGTDLEDAILKIKEDENDETDIYGSFEMGEVINDTLITLYNHPKYFNLENQQYRDITIQVINEVSEDTIAEYPIKIVRPSVLMVHGIWSDGDAGFGNMETDLLQSNMYLANQVLKMYYKSDAFNFENAPNYILNKNVLKILARKENISLGKIDVLAHSNGGLMSRLYIQSEQYQDDINKLITFNTPHSGSQMANLLLDPDFFFLHPPLEAIGNNVTNGVISDLRVNGSFIQQLNGLNASQFSEKYGDIGLHTISSTETIDNLVGNWDFLIVYYLKFHVEEVIDLFLENFIFQSPNHDVIVAEESQKAGSLATTSFPNQQHTGSTTNPAFKAKTKELLNENPENSNHFTSAGLNPPILQSNFNSLRNSSFRPSDETIDINSPAEGTEYQPGQIVTIEANGSPGIINIVSSMGNSLVPIQNHVTENNSDANFNLTVPNNAIGRLEITSVGFDANGYANFDSTFINVVTTAILESIEVTQQLIYVPEGRQSVITILGHYDDGIVRNITNVQDLIYSFENNYAEILENGLVSGITEGEEMLTITYLGKSTTVPITVANASEWVEVTLSSHTINESDTEIIRLTPNPTRNTFKIHLPISTHTAYVSVFDILGKKVLENKIDQSSSEIDISRLRSGIYLVHIQSAKISITKRVVKL